MSVSRNIRELRRKAGMTQDELAERIGVEQRVLAKWENGFSEPEYADIGRMAHIFGVPVSEISGKTDEYTAEAKSADRDDMFSDERKHRREQKQEETAKNEFTDTRNYSGFNDNPIASLLLPDEHILWQGRPDSSVVFTKQDIPITIFMCFWLGFAVFWTVAATAMGGVFGIFGLPFVAIGVYMMFGRFLLTKNRKKCTYYALTDKRVVIYYNNGAGKDNITSIMLPTIRNVKLDNRNSKTGTVTFLCDTNLYDSFGDYGTRVYTTSYGRGRVYGRRYNNTDNSFNISNPTAFVDISNARFVYDTAMRIISGNNTDGNK